MKRKGKISTRRDDQVIYELNIQSLHACRSCFVILISATDGRIDPDGWLCATIILVAIDFNAKVRIILISTVTVVLPPYWLCKCQ